MQNVVIYFGLINSLGERGDKLTFRLSVQFEVNLIETGALIQHMRIYAQRIFVLHATVDQHANNQSDAFAIVAEPTWFQTRSYLVACAV